jgi:hypothetical protein
MQAALSVPHAETHVGSGGKHTLLPNLSKQIWHFLTQFTSQLPEAELTTTNIQLKRQTLNRAAQKIDFLLKIIWAIFLYSHIKSALSIVH